MAKVALIILIVLLIPAFAFGGYIFYIRYHAKQANLPPPVLPFFGRRSNPFSDRNATSGGGSGGASGGGGGGGGRGGIFNTIRSKIPFLTKSNPRTGAGAYEQPLAPGGGSRAAAARGLDPDEAWDTRVGTEADGYGQGGYYEEQELGLHPGAMNNTYSGGGYGEPPLLLSSSSSTTAPVADLPKYGGSPISPQEEPRRGRSRSREPSDYIGGSQQQQQRGRLNARYDEEMGLQLGSKRDNPFEDDTAERSDLRGGVVGLRPMVDTEGGGPSRLGLGGHGKTGRGSGDSLTERRSLFHENI